MLFQSIYFLILKKFSLVVILGSSSETRNVKVSLEDTKYQTK